MAKNAAEEKIKNENATAGEWLLNYHARLKEYNIMCANFNILAGTVCDDMPHSSDTGDPSLKKAMLLVEINKYRDWLDVVELAEKTLSDKSKMFICFKRLAMEINFEDTHKVQGRPPVTDCVALKYNEWHNRAYGVGCLPARRTMAEWWDNIVANTVVRIAIRKKLL